MVSTSGFDLKRSSMLEGIRDFVLASSLSVVGHHTAVLHMALQDLTFLKVRPYLHTSSTTGSCFYRPEDKDP